MTHRVIILSLLTLLAVPTMAQPSTYTIPIPSRWGNTFDTVSPSSLLIHSTVLTANSPVGHPQLPVHTSIVTIPRGATLSLHKYSFDISDTIPLHLYSIAPATPPLIKDTPTPVSSIDTKIYNSDTYYTPLPDIVTIQHLGTMGDSEVYRVSTAPFSYNPLRHILIHRPIITLTLDYTPAPIPTSPSSGYLVVSRPQFRSTLQPFIQWKRQQGYDVTEIYADTNQRDSIKSLISPYFIFNDPTRPIPRYILLVGDAPQIQAFQGYSRPEGLSSHPTDLYYADYTGDALPDALLGRWPVNDTLQLRSIIQKTILYEQYSYIDTAHLNRTLLVAGNESSSPAPITTNGQVNYVAQTFSSTHPSIDTICYHNPASANARDQIMTQISTGAACINYTAHCTAAGWSSPSITFANIDTLTESYPSFYINNCCSSNDFSGTGFGEELLRKPHGGAVAVIGATNSTLWNEDYYWAVGPKYPFSINPSYDSLRHGAFDHWLRTTDVAATVSDILVAGNLAVTAFGSPYYIFYWEIYCLLGDPSLHPHLGIPQQSFLNVDSITFGASSITATATPGALVSVVQDSLLLATAVSDTAGHVILTLRHPADSTPITITATGPSLIPTELSITPSTNIQRGLMLRNVVTTQQAITATVENIGTDTLTSITLSTRQTASDSLTGAILSCQPAVIDTLLPHNQCTLTLSLGIAHIGSQAMWSATLVAQADSTQCTVPISHQLDITYPSAAFDILEPDTNQAVSLHPDHTYLLATVVEGQYDNASICITSYPVSDTLLFVTLSPDIPYNIHQFTIPESSTHLHISAFLSLGGHTTPYDYWLTTTTCNEGFEDGTLPAIWSTGGTQPWYIDNNTTHTGLYSIRSGAIDHRQTSDLTLRILLPHADSIAFWCKASSEPQYDRMLFYIDGAKRMENWGTSNYWRHYAFPLTAGTHTLLWRYVKDESNQAGEDCVWIDDIRLPMALWSTAYECASSPQDVGIISLNNDNTLTSVYPNPTTGILHIDCLEPINRIEIYDLYGRLILQSLHPNKSINITSLPYGIYILHLSGNAVDTYEKITLLH